MEHFDLNIEISVNSINFKNLLDLLIKCDSDFVPALSSYVDIKLYCKKLHKKAEIISAKVDKRIAGITAIYCNNQKTRIAYISLLCVDSKYRNKGIAKIMLKKAVQLALQKDMVVIRVQTSVYNSNAINLYYSQGYFFESKREFTIFMRKLLSE